MRTQACAFQTSLRNERGSRPEPTSVRRIQAPIQLLHKRFLAYANFLPHASPQAIMQPPRQDKGGMKPALKIFLKAKRRPASVVTIPHRAEPATRTRTKKGRKVLNIFSISARAYRDPAKPGRPAPLQATASTSGHRPKQSLSPTSYRNIRRNAEKRNKNLFPAQNTLHLQNSEERKSIYPEDCLPPAPK